MTLPLWGLVCLSILGLIHVSCDSFLLKLRPLAMPGPQARAIPLSAAAR